MAGLPEEVLPQSFLYDDEANVWTTQCDTGATLVLRDDSFGYLITFTPALTMDVERAEVARLLTDLRVYSGANYYLAE
jgi:hypothetical protein